MPTYDYECTKCGHRFEIFQRMTDAKIEKCPKCGGKVERLIGPGAGIVFKGSGFYQTDYRSSSYKEAAKSDKPAGESKSESGASGGASSGKADPPKKPSSKPDSKPTEPKSSS